MAPVTIQGFPCNEAVVALAAEFPVHDGSHVDVVGALLEDEYVLVAHLAFEPDPVEPVGEYYRVHSCLLHALRLAVKNDIPVLRVTVFCSHETHGYTNASQEENPEASPLHRLPPCLFPFFRFGGVIVVAILPFLCTYCQDKNCLIIASIDLKRSTVYDIKANLFYLRDVVRTGKGIFFLFSGPGSLKAVFPLPEGAGLPTYNG
jgi:hypothetical protein